MPRRNILLIIFTVLLALIGLIFLTAGFLPYAPLKSLAGSFMSDGNFKSLNENNAIVYRIILCVAGVLFMVAAFVFGGRRSNKVLQWLHHYFLDLTVFFTSLKPTKVDIFPLVSMLLILGSAIILRLVHIFEQFIHDEGYTFVVFSSTSLFNIVTNYHLPNNHVLNSLLIYFSTHLFGIQPWAVRLPSLLAGLLLIPATFELASQIYDKYTALLSAVLVTILPGAILYSTRARGYSLVALFTVLSFIIANYVIENKNLFAWSLLVLFSALGFYSVPVMLFPFGIIFVWLFFENLFTHPGPYGSKLNFLKYWLLAGLSTAALVLILYTPIFIYSGADKVFANEWVSPAPWSGYLSSILFQAMTFLPDWTHGLPSFWVILLGGGFFLSLVLHKRISKNRFPLQIAAFLWIIALFLIQRPQPTSKIWIYLQAPFVTWSAAGIIGLVKVLPQKFTQRVPIVNIVVIAGLLSLLVFTIKLAPTIPDHWNEKGSVETTVLAIKDQLNPADLIIIDSPYDAATWYYAELHGLPKNYFNKNLPFNQLFVIVDRLDGQTLQSVLQARGPDLNLIDLEASYLIMNYGYLDTYIVPHR